MRVNDLVAGLLRAAPMALAHGPSEATIFRRQCLAGGIAAAQKIFVPNADRWHDPVEVNRALDLFFDGAFRMPSQSTYIEGVVHGRRLAVLALDQRFIGLSDFTLFYPFAELDGIWLDFGLDVLGGPGTDHTLEFYYGGQPVPEERVLREFKLAMAATAFAICAAEPSDA